MKYFHTSIILLMLLCIPAISYGGVSSSIVNFVSVTGNSGSVHVESVNGADGQSVSSSAKGADGADGASGTVINGNSSSHVDVYTEINGKVIEDTHTTVTNDDAPYERTRVYEDGGTRVETRVKALAGSAQNAAKQKVQEVEVLHDKRESEVAPITNQYISERTDTSVAAVEVSESEPSASSMHRAVDQLHRILSGIFTYVSNIFA